VCNFVNKRGYSLIGKTAILHIVNSGSIPGISTQAREAQLVEQNLEAILVVSSSLTTGRDFSIMVNAYDF
jgi:hypothetical protein